MSRAKRRSTPCGERAAAGCAGTPGASRGPRTTSVGCPTSCQPRAASPGVGHGDRSVAGTPANFEEAALSKIGGLLLEWFSWASVFWLNVPIVGVALAGVGIAIGFGRLGDGGSKAIEPVALLAVGARREPGIELVQRGGVHLSRRPGVLHPDDRERALDALTDALESASPFNVSFWVRPKSWSSP